MFAFFLTVTVLLAVSVMVLAPRNQRRRLSWLAALLLLLSFPAVSKATYPFYASSTVVTPNGDGTVTVTDLNTGLSFIQAGPAAGFYGGFGTGFRSYSYGFGPSITVSRFGRLATFNTFGQPAFFGPQVFVDRFGRVHVR